MPNRSKSKLSLIGLIVFAAWVMVSLGAIFAMYHLWWTRERVLYIGQSPDLQRTKVFQIAGLPQVLPDIQKINKSWPLNMQYALTGSHTDQSYLIYLLSPRTPSDEGGASIHIEKHKLRYDAVQIQKMPFSDIRSYPDHPAAKSLIMSLILVLGVSFLLEHLRWPNPMHVPELVALSLLLLSVLVSMSRVINGSSSPGMWIMVFLGISGWLIKAPSLSREIKYALPKAALPSIGGQPTFHNGIRLMCAVIIVSGLIWSFLMSFSVVPDDWDAWATWGPKAKYLALGKGPLLNLTYLGMPDYPLMWPSIWGFSGWMTGGWEEHWSKAWGSVLALLTAWEIGLSINRQTGLSIAGWLGAASFISIPCVPLVASWAYAESTLWLMLACAFTSLLRWRDNRETVDLILAGIFSAAACHAKNEGLFFCLLILLWIAVNGHTKRLKHCAEFFLPVIVLYGPWFWWVKVKLELVSAVTRNLHFDAEHLNWALSRVPEGMNKVLSIWFDIKQWNIVLFLIFSAMVYALVKGGLRVRVDWMIPAGLLVGAFILNIFYDGPVGWMFGANWNRITLQVIPLLLMILFPYLVHQSRSVVITSTC